MSYDFGYVDLELSFEPLFAQSLKRLELPLLRVKALLALVLILAFLGTPGIFSS
jgi:hypothetical protein